MKVIRRLILAALCSCLWLPAGFALDFGGLLSSGVRGSGHERGRLDFRHTEDLTGWLRTPLNKEGNINLSAQATFSYEFLQQYREDIYRDYTADLDLLKLGYIEKPAADESLVISLGRFQYYHTTNIVFSQNCDGILFQYFAPKVQTSIYAGYTGLLNQKNVSILTEDGYVHSTDHDGDRWYKKLYDWADPYFASSFAISFPYLFYNQTLGFEASTFIGVRGPSKVRPEYNRYYLTMNLAGPLYKNLSYSTATTFFTEKFNKLGILSQFGLSYYTGYKNATFSLTSTYASGKNGFLGRFQSFTSNPATYARYTQEYTGLIKMGLSASIKPLPTVYLLGGADLVDSWPKNDLRYEGWQWYATIQVQCTSDCKLSLTEYRYYGDDSAMDNGGAILRLTISF